MVENVGKRLQKARLERRLSIDEAAGATKIRPERLTDLEADDYSHFPNLTYAKSFLAKYAKYLSLDIQEELETFQISRSVSLRDYQYLAPAHPKYVPEARPATSRGFRVPPLLVAVLVLIVLVGVPLLSYFAMNFSGVRKSDAAALAGPEQSPIGVAALTPAQEREAGKSLTPDRSIAANTAAPAGSANGARDQVSVGQSTPIPVERLENGVEVRRALPILPDTTAKTNDQPAKPPLVEAKPETSLGLAKLEIRALKRTWIRLTKDEPGSEPVFDGLAGPGSQPIIAEGERFWVKVRDKNAVEIRRNGQVVQGSSDGVVID
jgi:cytoskeletal protein RodZ